MESPGFQLEISGFLVLIDNFLLSIYILKGFLFEKFQVLLLENHFEL